MGKSPKNPQNQPFLLLKSAIRLRSRVVDLETSLARRGAVGGRQRLGETVEAWWRKKPQQMGSSP